MVLEAQEWSRQPTEKIHASEGLFPPFQVAIDGTVAAGKGAVSRQLAERLQFLYVDTGAMYRCVGLIVQREHIPTNNETMLLQALARHRICLRRPNEQEQGNRLITVTIDEEDVSTLIRQESVSALTSQIAQLPGLRQELVVQQQRLAADHDVVMEGRDITHTVLPNAQVKIYLDAHPQVRAQRRYTELLSKGEVVTYETILAELLSRDQRDQQKYLRKVPGVWEIDTSQQSTEEVVKSIFDRVQVLRTTR